MMDADKIEQLVKLAKESAISELTVRRDGIMVSIKKPMQTPPTQSSGPPTGSRYAATARPPAVAEPEGISQKTEPEDGMPITAPMVGIFHIGEGVQDAAAVHAGQVIGLIESMKLMNEIRSPADGVVEEILVDDGMPVEYGQSLFRLKSS
jgi:biotin carboxyl carrier protein